VCRVLHRFIPIVVYQSIALILSVGQEISGDKIEPFAEKLRDAHKKGRNTRPPFVSTFTSNYLSNALAFAVSDRWPMTNTTTQITMAMNVVIPGNDPPQPMNIAPSTTSHEASEYGNIS
jgi:hypothetical protein